MARTAADVLIDTLECWGVGVIFGLPGDGINGILESLRKAQSRIRFIQTRHEEAAAFASTGYAKFSGRLGVCLATTGPGATHLLTGLYDAKMDQMPVLAITGLPYHDLIGTCYQQDIATDRLFDDVALYSQRVMGPLHVETVTNHAIRAALSGPGVAHLAFPNDLQESTIEDADISPMNQSGHTSSAWQPSRILPHEEDLLRAATVLNEGRKVVIVAGAGARNARKELEELAERLDAPVAKALLGKDILPDESPYTTGTIGVFGTKATADAIKEADTLFLVGTSFPYIKYLPDVHKVRGVQIDRNPARLGIRFPVEVGLTGDVKTTLQALMPHLKAKQDRGFLEKTQQTMKKWWALMQERAESSQLPMRPQAVAWELGKHLAPDTIICGDSGQNTLYAARHIKIHGDQRFSCSGLLACMGCALPYAIGAQIAFPDRPIVAFMGDGGLSMVLAELATCVKYRLPIKIVVLKNNVLGMIRWEQMMFLGNPEFGVELQDIDFSKVAEACGMKSFAVERPDDLPSAIAALLAAEGPALLQATVDGFEPLMPGTLTPEQAAHFSEALQRGQPNAKRVGLTLYRDAVEELEPNASLLKKHIRRTE